MGRITTRSNYRVVIEPRRLGDFGSIMVSDRIVCGDAAKQEKEYEARCQEIVEDVKRHVDNAGSVTIEHGTDMECSHCGAMWTEEGTDYNGGCCDEDEKGSPRNERK